MPQPGTTMSIEQKLKLSATRQTRRGYRGPTVFSPFIPDTLVYFSKTGKRWYCNFLGKLVPHARAVYLHIIGGPIPAKWHIHHKNGNATNLDDDKPENLIAVPAVWNFRYFPTLAHGFGVPEAKVTEAYAKFYKALTGPDLFKAVCEELSR